LSYNEAKAVTETAFYEGEKQGREQGKIEGKIESKREIAKTMLAEGFEPSIIAKITLLSVDEIKRLY
jgi:predicted transposase/invertase (TIGR01784 family)